MSLRHILLGLTREAQSGYDLKKHFENSLKNFWNAELSQIYPLLQKLEKEGLLTSKKEESEIGPTKRVYKRSAKGGKELRDWLCDGPVVGSERIGHLAQVYFLADLGDEDKSIEYMNELRAYSVDRLTTLQAVEKRWSEQCSGYPDALPDDQFYAQLTLSIGLRKVRAAVDWCDECIARIQVRKQQRLKAG